MARERVAGAPGDPQSSNHVVGLPWRDPEQADFYLIRDPDERLIVRLNAEATIEVWGAYRLWKKEKRTLPLLMRVNGSYFGATTMDRAIEKALMEKCVIYNVAKRSCWRPIWWPSTPVDIRGLGNLSHEPVHIYGCDSFVEGWADRPRAKLFINS